MLLSLIFFLLCLTALMTFWQPHGLFSAVITSLSGGLIILIASFSQHAWAHGLAIIGWAVVALIAVSGLGTLALILLVPHRVLRKRERLTWGLRLGIGSWVILGGGWTWAVLTGHFSDTLWPWLTFIPVFSLYLGVLYAASLVGYCRASLHRARHADTLVVLGAGLVNGNQVGRILGARLDTALALAKRQSSPVTLLVTGGQGSDETVSEAAAMAAYLQAHGFPADRIVQETAATNTLTNLFNSQRLWVKLPQQGGRVVLITSSYHLFRTQILAHHLGIRCPGVPAPTRWAYLPMAWAREFLAILMLHPRLHRGVLVTLVVINGLWLLI